jgi:MurNAc alpha-1-phosphate uridylyltransferase
MRPLTDNLPKPLIPVAGTALIDRILDWLYASHINEAVVNSHYLAPALEAHLAQRRTPKIHISREDPLLETGGGIKKALPLLGKQPFFAVNSDTLCIDGDTPALERLMNAWDERNMDALLLLYPVEKAIGYEGKGDFFLNDDGTLRRRGDAPSAPFVFTGVQLLHPRIFQAAPDGAFSMNLLYDRLMQQVPARLQAVVHDGASLHVGDAQGLKQAEAFLS